MAWYRQATNHYLNQCWPRLLPPYGVSRPQCVKETVKQSSVGTITVPSGVFHNMLDWVKLMVRSTRGQNGTLASPSECKCRTLSSLKATRGTSKYQGPVSIYGPFSMYLNFHYMRPSYYIFITGIPLLVNQPRYIEQTPRLSQKFYKRHQNKRILTDEYCLKCPGSQYFLQCVIFPICQNFQTTSYKLNTPFILDWCRPCLAAILCNMVRIFRRCHLLYLFRKCNISHFVVGIKFKF